MLNFISSQFLFYFSILLVLFTPGYFLMLSIFGKKQPFSSLEKFIISFGSSILVVDFLMILIGKMRIPITRISVIGAILFFSATCGLIFYLKNKKGLLNKETKKEKQFSKRQLIAVLAIIFLTIFIKTVYLKDAILPTSTDLGHHMYWAKTIAVTGQLPIYEKVDVSEDFALTQPQPIVDFIIGEHLIFSAIGLISGIDYISYFPVLILYLIHMMGILTMFSLTLLFFKNSPFKNMIGIMTFFLLGPIYSLASPQTKFVSGGVIGNTLGNLLIPLAIYFFVRALSEKSSKLFAYAIFVVFGLAYTHHLSTFVFVFVFVFSAIFFTIFNLFTSDLSIWRKQITSHFQAWSSIIFSKPVLSILALGFVFVFFLYTPTYLNKSAVDTAVGAPSKATRMGLTMTELKFAAGEARMALGIIGVTILLFAKNRASYAVAFLFGWFFSITIMSLRPNWLFIDIPSNRIASYIGFPVAIFAGFALVKIFTVIKNEGKNYLNSSFIISTFFAIMTFIAVSGSYDNSQTLNIDSQPESVLQTYHASKYLADASDASDMVIKDHNYLTADSWMKLNFMRGYNYPLSRGFFKRYSDETKPREQCTLLMISTPSSADAKKCFDGTKTNFLMVNPKIDSAQFTKSNDFWRIYSAEDIAIFHKAK